RLTGETVLGLFTYSKSFAYDAVGNRQTQTTTGAGSPGTPLAPGTIGYGYDTRDRLTAEGPQAYTWEDNGNLTTKDAEAAYVWAQENRLRKVTKTDGTVVEYVYDADSNRVQTKTSPSGEGSATLAEYLVDTSGSLSQVVADVNTTTPATPTFQALYVRGD